jgi:hypothetical protein
VSRYVTLPLDEHLFDVESRQQLGQRAEVVIERNTCAIALVAERNLLAESRHRCWKASTALSTST